MKKQKQNQIQISKLLFYKLYLLLVDDGAEYLDEKTYDKFLKDIKEGLKKKYESMYRRELYTKAIISDSEEDRVKAREQYLEEIGVPKDFRYPIGYKNKK